MNGYFTVHAIQEITKRIDLLLGQLTPSQSLLDPWRDQLVVHRRRHGLPLL
jgi:hypothetical protein